MFAVAVDAHADDMLSAWPQSAPPQCSVSTASHHGQGCRPSLGQQALLCPFCIQRRILLALVSPSGRIRAPLRRHEKHKWATKLGEASSVFASLDRPLTLAPEPLQFGLNPKCLAIVVSGLPANHGTSHQPLKACQKWSTLGASGIIRHPCFFLERRGLYKRPVVSHTLPQGSPSIPINRDLKEDTLAFTLVPANRYHLNQAPS